MTPRRSLPLTAAAAAAALLLPSVAAAQEITERLAARDPLVFKSAKQPADLELCVADAISRIAPTAAFRDGPNRSVVTATYPIQSKIAVAVELNGSAAGTTVIAHFFPAGGGQRYSARLQSCM